MSPVDDIIINKQIPQKKKGKGIIVVFFFLLIVLAGLCYAYYWYTNSQETPKMAFFKYIGQTNTNISEILNTEIYYNMLEKINAESYETSTTADFTTTKKTDFTENVDVSKFEFTLDIKSNKDTEEAFVDGNITYSSNDFFDLKFVSTKDAVAIGSNEILDKYIASSKESLGESISKTTGNETDVNADYVSEEIEKLSKNKIDLAEEFKTQKANEYMSLIMEKVPEEAVTLVEASPITINSNVINTDAYTLSLDGQTYSSLAKELLEKLKNDEELLSKIVTENGTEVEEEPEEVKPKQITTIKPVGGETEEHNTSQEINSEDLQVLREPDMGALLESEEMVTPNFFNSSNEAGDNIKENKEEDSIFLQILSAISLNQKLDISLEELKTKIEEEADKIVSTDELKVTLYVKNVEGEEKKTIKIVAALPEGADLDIEYSSANEIKLTFLQDDNGESIELKRTNANTQTQFNIKISSIEAKKVIKKLQVDLTTKGTKTSKTYSNDIIIKYNDNEGDYKINIENNLDFKDVEVGQEINEENSIFVDQLSDEEANNLYANIVLKLMEVYSEKILNMNFIDTNSSSGVVEQPEKILNATATIPSEENTDSNRNEEVSAEEDLATRPFDPEGTGNTDIMEHISKIGARDLLVAKIEEMMADSEEHEEEFSILNLDLLPEELDGWKVEKEVTEEGATVKVAGYTFHIDKDFMLTEE